MACMSLTNLMDIKVGLTDETKDENLIRDCKTWNWCDKHKYNNKGVVTNGMYVTHKPDGHQSWVDR